MTNAFRWNVGLLFVLGLLTTIGFNLWRIVQPYTQPPPRPEFATEAKPKKPLPSKPQASPTPTEKPKPSIGVGKVVPDIGLILRDQPTSESGGTAGVEFNAEVLILEESQDGEWLKVEDANTGATGWVRSGNIDRVSQ